MVKTPETSRKPWSDIAKIVGVSQMHVSRLIARALETLRRIAEEGDL